MLYFFKLKFVLADSEVPILLRDRAGGNQITFCNLHAIVSLRQIENYELCPTRFKLIKFGLHKFDIL